ncbi:hypothetical protein NGB36_04030 [Streptomyces sp. RB6PN25]|uniref:Uncharacterized protein n=1 Tax=Streptomyces humicola TaxID=2953240 RepID=A0ABT1PS53_9ACTN|nr:hypothetical protein [Streptomyces humicola]MCQ4079780.1 hypothetical protein [Streptomyces humicola]
MFEDYYGQVTEPAARAAVKLLHAQGKTPSTEVGGMPRDVTVHPLPSR